MVQMQPSWQTSRIRFGLGASPSDAPSGDPRDALKAELAGPDPAFAAGAFDGLASGREAMDALAADRAERRAQLAAGNPPKGGFASRSREMYLADAKTQLLWAATTRSSFRERLVWFWTNHFTVSIFQGGVLGLAGPFVREAIRPHVTGSFTEMVLAVERHPAMLLYLGNAGSIGPGSVVGQRTGRGLNENLGRECMELHTVGLQAGYAQADVTSMAKILTGWSAAGSQGGGDATGFKFRAMAHEPGLHPLMGRNFDGAESAGISALTFLSRYPTTYQLLAKKLATHFVADTPPPAAITKIARVLAETGGDLAAAAAALVDLPEAWAPLTKLKTPAEYVVSAMRALPPAGQVNPQVLARLGQPLWGAPLPNGWSDQAADWDGSAAILSRLDWAWTYAAHAGDGQDGPQPDAIARTALGPLLQARTASALAQAGSRREAVALLLAAPEFQRR